MEPWSFIPLPAVCAKCGTEIETTPEFNRHGQVTQVRITECYACTTNDAAIYRRGYSHGYDDAKEKAEDDN